MTETDCYTNVPYPNPPIGYSQPEILAVSGTWRASFPAPVDRCRVLELGCGEGGNLVPMAVDLRESRVRGDRSLGDRADRRPRDHRGGRTGAPEPDPGVQGVESLPTWTGWASSDYIVTHGVFSWVARPEIQEKILAICREQPGSGPKGVAYVSYNTYPGLASCAA